MDVILVQPLAGVNGLEFDPPVSRTGSKRRFREVIEGILGYHRRDVRLSWRNDTDLGCYLLNLVYADAQLAQAVTRLIWAMVPCPDCLPQMVEAAARGEAKPTPGTCVGQAGCPICSGTGVQEARQLWERLRKAPIPADVADCAAVWGFLQARSYGLVPIRATEGWHTNGFKPEEHDGRIYHCGKPPGRMNPRDEMASRFASLRPGAPSIVTRLDAGLVTLDRLTGTLAAWMVLQSRNIMQKSVGVRHGIWSNTSFRYEYDPTEGHDGTHARGWQNPRWTLAASLRTSDTPAVVSRLDAGQVLPDLSAQALDAPAGGRLPVLLPWTGRPYRMVIYLDPPYLGPDGDGGKTATTGYGDTFSRKALLELCQRWIEAGRRDEIEVTVAVSEACDLSDELAEATGQDCHGYDIGRYVTRKSSFWARADDADEGPRQREWLTCSCKAVSLPAVQESLW